VSLVHIDAIGGQPREIGERNFETTLNMLQNGSSPIIILLHGFRYDPKNPDHCPHNSLYAVSPNSHIARANVSWVNGLGFTDIDRDENLCIGFGWAARGTIWRANANARHAAIALRKVMNLLRRRFPNRPISILAHSLGAHVALGALHGLAERAVDRMVLMSPAVMQNHAQAALGSLAGRSVEVINIISRQNDLYDAALEWMLHPRDAHAKALGNGLGIRNQNWLDVEIDNPQVTRALAGMGFPLEQAPAAVCHWSCYTRAGIFDFYKSVLCHSDETPLAELRALLSVPSTPRWSRLVSPDMRRIFLPFALKS